MKKKGLIALGAAAFAAFCAANSLLALKQALREKAQREAAAEEAAQAPAEEAAQAPAPQPED